MFNINIHYPSHEEEREIVKRTTMPVDHKVKPVLHAEDIVAMQRAVREIPVSDHVLDFAVKLARSTRPDDPEAPDFIKQWVNWGAGPRASQYMVLGAKARAALQNRLTPSIEDVVKVALIVMQHRVIVSFAAEAEGMKSKDVILRLIESITPKN